MGSRALINAFGGTAAFAVAAACLMPAVPALGATASVGVGNFAYTPQIVTIDQGDAVMWRWVGPDTFHDVLSEPGQADPFASHPDGIAGPPPFNVFGHSFSQAGTFDYFCSIHPSMRGTVVVAPVAQQGGNEGTPAAQDTSGVQVGKLGGPPVCTSARNFRIRIRAPRGESIVGASVTVNGKPVDVRAEPMRIGWRFTAPVDLRGLPKGTYDVRIKARAADGRTLRGSRRYRTCAPKLSPSALPRL